MVELRPWGKIKSGTLVPPRLDNDPEVNWMVLYPLAASTAAWPLSGRKIAVYHRPETMKLLTVVGEKMWVSLIWPSYSGWLLEVLKTAGRIRSVEVGWSPWSTLKRPNSLSELLML